MKFALALLFLAVSISSVYSWPHDRPVDRNKLPKKVVCYWGTWSYYRSGPDGKFEAENINPHLCNYIMYGFAKLSNNKIALYDPDLDTGDEEWSSGLTWGHGMIRRVNELRKYNPNLATMISIGGWNEGSDKYSKMVSSKASRTEFVHSVVEFLKKHEFDGLDLDWEYPSMKASGDMDRTPGRDADKHDYVSLLKELHDAFKPYGFILSAAVSAGRPTIDRAYDVPQVSKYLDFINLMAYDYHGGWDVKTAHNAPLYPLPGATGIDLEFTVSYSVEHWLKLGADPKKLVLGIPLYGRSFTLKGSEHDMNAPVTGKGGDAGPITKIVGMLGYNEICALVKGGWQTHWNEIQQVPYATHASQWVGYDNIRSVQKKLDYISKKHLIGAMLWSLETDDFSGHCGEGKFPLLKTIAKTLNHVDTKDVHIPRTHATTKHPGGDHQTAKPDHHTPAPHHTKKPNHGGSFHCTHAGFFADPKDPHKFHQCVDFSGHFKDYSFTCPGSTTFDDKSHVCK